MESMFSLGANSSIQGPFSILPPDDYSRPDDVFITFILWGYQNDKYIPSVSQFRSLITTTFSVKYRSFSHLFSKCPSCTFFVNYDDQVAKRDLRDNHYR